MLPTEPVLGVLAAALLVAAGLPPDTGALCGTVRDPQGLAIQAARVEIACGAQQHQTITGIDGAFLQPGLPAGDCVVTASAAQFERGRASVAIAPGSTATVVFTLRVSGFAFAADVVVTPGKGAEEQASAVPESVSAASRSEIDARPYQLLPQVLREEPGVLLQQTTSSQTSPTIRGFTGQSIVYLVDGVRLNTSAWRTGPSQYLGWINAAAVDRIEVVRGPGSVQSGSDALGGTLQMVVAAPPFSVSGVHVGGFVEGQAGSAERAGAVDAEVYVQGGVAAFRAGTGTRRVEDMRAGRGRDSHAAVTTFLGLPSAVLGERLIDTGFTQSGAYVVGRIRAGTDATLSTSYLHSDQQGASRYDRLLGGTGLFRSGFDPQTLDFGLVRYERAQTAGLDSLSATFSVNRQADGRFEQARPAARLDRQKATTTALGYQAQGSRRYGRDRRHSLVFGADFYDESIGASRVLEDTVAQTSQPARPDIPDGTTYNSLGVFAQQTSELVSGRLSVRAGARYGRYAFRSVADAALGVPDETVVSDALTFQTGAVVRLTDGLTAALNVSRGFRAANAADLGGIGLSGGGGFEISPAEAMAASGIVGTSEGVTAVSSGQPVASLQPEVLWAFEPSIRFRSGRVSASLAAFDLEMSDSIQRRAIVFPVPVVGATIAGFTIVRQDASGLAYIAQDPRPVATRVNVDRARTVGLDAEAGIQVSERWSATGFYSMANGRVLGGDYLRRMPPPLGGARLRWSGRGGNRWIEGVVSFAGRQTRLSAGDLGDARIGAPRTRSTIAGFFNGTATDLGLVQNGVLVETGETLAEVQARVLGTAAAGTLYTETPGFAVFGLRGGWRFGRQFELTIIGENLTDRNYRLHGSGVDGPGVNVEIRARYRF